MTESLLNPQTLLIGGLAIAALLLWKLLGAAKPQVPKKNSAPVFLFTRKRQVYASQAENALGILLLDRAGGFFETRNTAVTVRSGRGWRKPRSDSSAATMQKRSIAYMLREGDPNPLALQSGAAGGYHGHELGWDELRALRDLNARDATREALKHQGSLLQGRLAIVAGIAVAGAVAMWLGLGFTVMLRGQG